MSYFEQSANSCHRGRERDPHDIVTGTRNSQFLGLKAKLKASHMFPLAYLELVRIGLLAS